MNGGDSISWAKKPAVPDNRKRAVSKKTIEKRYSKKYCQKCALQGINSPVQLFQLNDEEALLMCKNVDCTFMPASNWESLVVKRDISKLSVGRKQKGVFSSASSASSSHNNSDHSTHSAPLIKRHSQSAPQSRSDTPVSDPVTASKRRPSLSTVSKVQKTLPDQRSLASPVLSLKDSVSRDKERKTFVPIAPFLCGHAHTFSSFETSKLVSKLQQHTGSAVSPRTRNSFPGNTKLSADPGSQAQSEIGSFPGIGIKRRASSLDSDSLSSDSGSLDSRPTTPNSALITGKSSDKNIKHILVPPETLSKLLDGSLKVGIRREKKSRQEFSVVFKPVVSVGGSISGHCEEPSPSCHGNNVEIPALVSTATTTLNASTPVPQPIVCEKSLDHLEITPVGFLDDILKFTSSTSGALTLNSPSLTNSGSVQSHIDAINLHLQALGKALSSDNSVSVPADLSAATANVSNIVATSVDTNRRDLPG